MSNYIAIDQYGQTVKLPNTKHPRKALLDKLGYRSAQKLYQDKKDGTTVHCGYIVGGCWYTLYQLERVENRA